MLCLQFSEIVLCLLLKESSNGCTWRKFEEKRKVRYKWKGSVFIQIDVLANFRKLFNVIKPRLKSALVKNK